jgi:hypothetical protein
VKRKKRSLAPLGLMLLGGLLLVGAVVMLVAFPPLPAAAPTPTSQPALPADDGLPRVSVGDARAAFDLQQAVFVDVRDRAFYTQSHIPGALSLPLNELETRLDELDPADWIITYCT